MKKNVAGQFIEVQMVTAADGTAFTGSTTVYITKDNGTQTIGSVGSGVCTHKGNGAHAYAPAQAETNADHIAFTFIGTGAIPVTLNVYTNFPQSVDNNVLAAGATGFAAIDTVVDAIKAKTDNLPIDPADQSLIIAATDSITSDIAALNNLSTAQVLTQVNAALDAAIAELGVGAPANTPSLRTAMMAAYMFLINGVEVDRTGSPAYLTVKNAAGTVIFKKALTDDGTSYTEAKAISG